MKNSKKNIDRGKLLKTIVEKSGVSIISLVKKIGYKDRASYYSHINKPDLSLDILSSYARALNYDLRQDFPGSDSFMLEDSPSVFLVMPNTFEEALDLLGKWKERYYQLMEKYMKLLEEKS